MTVVDAPPRRSRPTPEGSGGRLARAWGAPVWVHLLALGLVLIALVPVVGTDAHFSGDEGAAAIQAGWLERGEGWIVPHPVPEADPTGGSYPLGNAERGTKGAAPFAKHPVYTLALAGAGRVAGFPGMVALSILGTIAAAGLAAALARRVAPHVGLPDADSFLVRPTLWVVGLASPLFFDGYIVIAHTLSAAAATAAVLAALVALERSRPALAFLVMAATALAVLLRTEALFLGVALAVATGVIAVRKRQRVALHVAGAALLGAGAARVGEQMWIRHIVGGPRRVGGSVGNGGNGLISGRVSGFVHTWLEPSHLGHRQVTFALVTMLVALVVGTVAVRRHPGHRRLILLMSVVAGLAAVVALVVQPDNLVPGLLVAFPLAAPGFLLLRRSVLGTTAAQVAVVTFSVFAGAVIATQYSQGGTAEWGGRYFAVGLPIIVPVLLLAIREAGRDLTPTLRRATVICLVVCSVALATMGIGSLRNTHRFTARLMHSIDQAGRQLGTPGPVFVTTSQLAPRISWRTFDRQRWLLVAQDDLKAQVDRLRAAGIDKFVLVTQDLRDDRALLSGTVETASTYGRVDGKGWQVRLLRAG